ncbi:MAG: hypothetical protein PQJ46_14670 [Spirochaetales bacterium]|nr:hypothetical protein [Spirochaetales bacterium]
MIRIAKQTDPKKLKDLKDKINDPAYLDVAISRIAQTLTKELVNQRET